MRKTGTKQWLIGRSRWLGKVPSLGYAFFYFLLIPMFAAIYYFLPDHSFYHSTIKFEQALDNDERVILQRLQNEIVQTFRRAHGEGEVQFGNWRMNADSISLRALRVSESELNFQLDIQLTNLAENKQLVSAGATIKGPLMQWAESLSSNDPDKDRYVIEYRSITIDASRVSPFSTNPSLGKVIFPESPPKMQLPTDLFGRNWETDQLIMPIPRELNENILAYEKGIEGFPSGLTGNRVRMFYLSAATITTLGYGDILPLTTPSRILVSAEAILGIVILGLFLNALAQERDNLP
jgi:Ion channel